jgi:protein-ribulosamine 3-kinase
MADLQRALAELLPSFSTLTDSEPVGGGCISEARRVRFRDMDGRDQVVFAKSNVESCCGNFQAEWKGLIRLGEPSVIGVPQPLAVGTAAGRAWLVTSWIEQGRRGSSFFSLFGNRLAGLHQATLGTTIGLDHENFLGSARQINAPCDNWVEFFAANRIGFQIGWAVDQGLADGALRRDCEQIVHTMDNLLAGRDDQTSLLHGDLWSGNYLCDRDGGPVIIDPAVYYGCREAEFGMLRLFGSCPDDFYQSYLDTFPLPDGWQSRVRIYVLYHLLNHLNLFGSGYYGQCSGLAAEILSR